MLVSFSVVLSHRPKEEVVKFMSDNVISAAKYPLPPYVVDFPSKISFVIDIYAMLTQHRKRPSPYYRL